MRHFSRLGRVVLAFALLALATLPAAPTQAALPPRAVTPPPPGDLVAWVTLSSFDAVLAIADDVATLTGKGALKPSANAMPMLTASATAFGLTDLTWLDRKKPIRAMLFDAPAGQREAGLVLAVPLTSPDKLKAAAKDAPPSEHHFLQLAAGTHLVYVDVVPGYALFALDGERFAKIRARVSAPGWIGALPGTLTVGVDVRSAERSFAEEFNAVMGKIDGAMQDAASAKAGDAGGDLVKQAMSAYVAILRHLIGETDTAELYVDLRAGRLVLGYRVAALPGTSLEQMLTSGRGRRLEQVTGWVPRQSYLVALSNDDPAGKRAFLGQMIQLVGTFLGLNQPGALATVADYNALMDLSTGEGALALFPDGDAAVGFLSVSGYTDGQRAAELGGRLLRQGAGKLLDFVEAQDKADAATGPAGGATGKKAGKGKAAAKSKTAAKGQTAPTPAQNEGKQAAMRIARQAVATGSLTPLLTLLQTVLPPTVQVQQGAVHEPGLDCDTLTVTVDWTAFQMPEAKLAQALIGNAYVGAVCVLPKALVVVTGPHAVAQARRIATGQSDGLQNEPSFKNALTAAPEQPSSLFYVRPAPLVNAVQAVVPPDVAPKLRDLAALPDVPVWAVGLAVGSTLDARFSLPVSWVVWGVGLARGAVEGEP